MAHESLPLKVHRPSDISFGVTASRGQRFFTNHETRNTNHGFFSKHETRNTAFPVARLVPVGTEALQSCFLRSGVLGVRKEEPFLRSRDAKICGVNDSNEKG